MLLYIIYRKRGRQAGGVCVGCVGNVCSGQGTAHWHEMHKMQVQEGQHTTLFHSTSSSSFLPSPRRQWKKAEDV